MPVLRPNANTPSFDQNIHKVTASMLNMHRRFSLSLPKAQFAGGVSTGDPIHARVKMRDGWYGCDPFST